MIIVYLIYIYIIIAIKYIHGLDINELPTCSEVLGNVEIIQNICKNNSICKANTQDGYIELLCDCSKLNNNTHYFVGKYCEIAIPHPSISSKDINETKNTCFLEDLLGINEWKNNFTIYSKLIR